jgi:integration host factor subunit alpha
MDAMKQEHEEQPGGGAMGKAGAGTADAETSALTKAQLADLLFEQIGLNKRESKDMVDAFFDLITDSLVQGEDVKISSFGNFQIRTKAPRPGRNPRTGEPVAIEARRVVTFHASPKLKETVQEG